MVLDFYRFIAATSVAFYHFGLYDPNGMVFQLTKRFNLFVDFFFVLSGFVIALSYGESVGTWRGIGVYLRRRFARIYPLHLLTFILFLVPVIFLTITHRPIPNPEKYDLALIPAQLLLVHSWPLNVGLSFNYPAWSISVEFAMYLLFPLIVWVNRRAGLIAPAAVVVGGFAAIEIMRATGIMMAEHWDDNYSPIRALPTFTIGMIIAASFRKITWGLEIGMVSLLVAIALMVAHANNYLIIAAFTSSIFFTASGELARPNHYLNLRFIRMLGDASYSVYMLHAFVLIVLVGTIWPRLKTGPMPVSYGIIILLQICCLSVLTYNIFEKPMRDWISGKKARSFQLAAGNLR